MEYNIIFLLILIYNESFFETIIKFIKVKKVNEREINKRKFNIRYK
jgi:hypothetical protein